MRMVRTAVLAVALALAAPPLAAPASADGAHPWDATWFGDLNGDDQGVQVIVAGDQVVGFFFNGDYVDVTESDPVAADGSLTFKWKGGTATLSSAGGQHNITIQQPGAADHVIPLTQDQ